MNLAFLTEYDPLDVRAWSGTPYFLLRELRREQVPVDPIGPLCTGLTFPFRLRSFLQKRAGLKQHLWDRDPFVLKALARAARSKLLRSPADLVFSPGTIPISRLDCRQPIVFWTDMTFAGALDFYLPRASVSERSLRQGHQMEQAALDRASLAIFSSDWARTAALANYRVDPAKLKVVPLGSNVCWNLAEDDVNRMIESRDRNTCRLLFVGVDWIRKGGPFALQVAALLNRAGIPTRLTIVGCRPGFDLPAYVQVYPFLNKGLAADLDTFRNLVAETHFLLLPSLADCTPMVIGEANSAGVPCVCTDVGGIPSQVRPGSNGNLFPLTAPAELWADWIARHLDPGRYECLARSSYREYATRLNWTSSVHGFLAELRSAGLA